MYQTSYETSTLSGTNSALARRSSSFARFGGGGEKCNVCTKTVFAAERMTAQEKVYHEQCFRCRDCNMKLGPANWCMDTTGQLWCKPHFLQAMSASGGKFDLGASDDMMPSPRHSVTTAPRPAAAARPPASTPAPAAPNGSPAPTTPAPKSTAAHTPSRSMRSSSFGRFGGGGEKCRACSKTVYAAER